MIQTTQFNQLAYIVSTEEQYQPKILQKISPTFKKLCSDSLLYTPISLSEMEGVSLLDRLDTKFVMSDTQLLKIFNQLRDLYWILEVEGNRLNHYCTHYFDSPGFDLYHAHVNERPERYKVRCREYSDSGLSFLEVKHRTRKDRTIKDRIRVPRLVSSISSDMNIWLNDVYPWQKRGLESKLWNTFTRITLVNKKYCERVTLDVDIAFYAQNRKVHLNGLAVAEVKMDGKGNFSPFLRLMREQSIRSQGFSKYAIGIAMLYENVKTNNLKPRLLMVEKMMRRY